MSNDQERREYKRIEKPFMVRFRTIPLVAKKMVSPGWDIVAVKNLSAGGMRFNYKKDLGLGSLLDLKIDISKSTPTINCVGKVTRIDHSHLHSMLRIATEFTEIDEQEKEVINTTVEEIIK
ncbi:MAG: PilZ domain-containing protein [Candidatus Scalindua sp.]